MSFRDIITQLLDRDEEVTRCFFFWDGPTLERIEEIRRSDPIKAAKLPRPICATARPVLLRTLCRLYGPGGFDYAERVSSLYDYLMSSQAFAKIHEPDRLMGYLATVAYNFWLADKKKTDQLLENSSDDTLCIETHDTSDDMSGAEMKRFVAEVLAAMPNRSYARLLDEEVLEIVGLNGAEKAARTKQAAERYGLPVDHFYVRVSLAKKQFKATAQKLMKERL